MFVNSILFQTITALFVEINMELYEDEKLLSWLNRKGMGTHRSVKIMCVFLDQSEPTAFQERQI